MRSRVISGGLTAAITILILSLSASGRAQPQDADPGDPAPRRADGTPDLSGVWARPYVPDMTVTRGDQRGTPDLPFTAWGRENWESYDPAEGDYTGNCMPYGMTRSVNGPFPLQIMQTDAYVTLLFELNTWFHVIPVDGRDHPEEPNPTWFGHSVGHWDGDRLVVETIGFNGWTRLDTIGHPHSDQLRLTQTFARVDAGHLAYTVTVDDPKAYTEPWTNERTFTLMDGELMEYSCEENNRSLWEGRIAPWKPPWAEETR